MQTALRQVGFQPANAINQGVVTLVITPGEILSHGCATQTLSGDAA